VSCIESPLNALTLIKKSGMKNFLAASLGQFENTESSYLKAESTGDFAVSLYAVRKELIMFL